MYESMKQNFVITKLEEKEAKYWIKSQYTILSKYHRQ